MPRILVLLFLWLSALSGHAAASQASQTCMVLNRVAELPAALGAAWTGRLAPDGFSRQVEAAQRGLWSMHTVLAGDPDDIAALWSVVHGVKRVWDARHFRERSPDQGSGYDLSQARHDHLIGIFDKFGCGPTILHGSALMFGVLPMSVAISGAAFFGLGAILSLVGFVRLRRRRRAVRRMCHLPALLRYDRTCTVTTVVDIGRGGAKVKAPEGGFGTTEVTLHLKGLSVPARVRWENGMYAGLSFVAVQPDAAIREMLTQGDEDGRLRDLTNAVPACFAPDCHLSCSAHRAAHLPMAAADTKRA